MYGVCLGLGVGILMLSPTLADDLPGPAAVVGLILIGGGIAVKVKAG